LAISMAIFTSCGSDDDTTPVDPILCDSLVVQINLTNDTLNNILTVETFGYTGPLNYAWSNGETTESITVDLTDEGTYSVTVTADGVEDCEATGSIDLTNVVDCTSLSVSIEVDTFLTANVTGGTAPYTYLWSNGDTGIMTELTAEGLYVVSVTDANGCIAVDSYDYELPGVDCSTFVGTFFQVDSFGVKVLSANVSGGTGPYTYEWSTGDVTQWGYLEVSVTGTYTVTVTDANGCVVEGTYVVDLINDPCANYGVSIFFNPDSLQMGQDYLVAQASGSTVSSSYLWSTGETGGGIEVTGQSGTFSVTATDSNGCTAEDSYDL